jgi:hypothetical protein
VWYFIVSLHVCGHVVYIWDKDYVNTTGVCMDAVTIEACSQNSTGEA